MNDFTPKYISVYNEIKKAIEEDIYPQGSFIPTEKVLMDKYGASRTTVRSAIELLASEGIIEVKQGRGTRVLFRNTIDTDYGLQRSHEFNSISIGNRFLSPEPHKIQAQGAVIDIIEAGPSLGNKLQVSENEKLFRLQRVKLVNSEPFAYVLSFIPVSYCPALDELNGQISNLYQTLEEKYSIRISNGTEEISAISAGFLESKILNVKTGAPLVLNSRIALSDNKIIEYSETTYNPSLYRLSISMGNVRGNQD